MRRKYMALLLAAVLSATALTGCGREPEPTTDEAVLYLMEREILRRDRELPPAYIQYHAEHGIPVEAEETAGVRTILKEIGRYLPEGLNEYISQADQIVKDVGDVVSQAQGVLDQVDSSLTSGAGKDMVDSLTSGSGRELLEQYTSDGGKELTSGEGREILDELTSGAAGELIDGILEQSDDSAMQACASLDEAVAVYYGAMYEKNLRSWRCILPEAFTAQHPDYAKPFAGKIEGMDTEACLPGGLESLAYTAEDVTEELAAGGEAWDALRALYASYGVEEIDGAWCVAANWEADGPGSASTEIVVRSGGCYYVPYPLEKLDAYYNENW